MEQAAELLSSKKKLLAATDDVLERYVKPEHITPYRKGVCRLVDLIQRERKKRLSVLWPRPTSESTRHAGLLLAARAFQKGRTVARATYPPGIVYKIARAARENEEAITSVLRDLGRPTIVPEGRLELCTPYRRVDFRWSFFPKKHYSYQATLSVWEPGTNPADVVGSLVPVQPGAMDAESGRTYVFPDKAEWLYKVIVL